MATSCTSCTQHCGWIFNQQAFTLVWMLLTRKIKHSKICIHSRRCRHRLQHVFIIINALDKANFNGWKRIHVCTLCSTGAATIMQIHQHAIIMKISNFFVFPLMLRVESGQRCENSYMYSS